MGNMSIGNKNNMLLATDGMEYATKAKNANEREKNNMYSNKFYWLIYFCWANKITMDPVCAWVCSVRRHMIPGTARLLDTTINTYSAYCRSITVASAGKYIYKDGATRVWVRDNFSIQYCHSVSRNKAVIVQLTCRVLAAHTVDQTSDGFVCQDWTEKIMRSSHSGGRGYLIMTYDDCIYLICIG